MSDILDHWQNIKDKPTTCESSEKHEHGGAASSSTASSEESPKLSENNVKGIILSFGEAGSSSAPSTTTGSAAPSPVSDILPHVSHLFDRSEMETDRTSNDSGENTSTETTSTANNDSMIGCLKEEALSSPRMTVEERKQRIRDFAAALVEPTHENVSAHHVEVSVPYRTIIPSEDSTALSEQSTASPSSQGVDVSPDDGVMNFNTIQRETHYAKLVGYFSKAKGWVLDMNSGSTTSPAVGQEAIRVQVSGSSIQVALEESKIIQTSSWMSWTSLQVIKAQEISFGQILRQASSDVMCWALFHVLTIAVLLNYIIIAFEDALTFVTKYLLKWVLIGAFLFIMGDLALYGFYSLCCEVPLVRATLGLSTWTPFIGSRLPAYETLCPPTTTGSLKVICKTFALDPEEFRACGTFAEEVPEPRATSAEQNSVTDSFKDISKLGFHHVKAGIDLKYTGLDIEKWNEALRSFSWQLFYQNNGDKRKYITPVLGNVTSMQQYTSKVQRHVRLMSNDVWHLMYAHESGTVRTSAALEMVAFNVSTWSRFTNWLLPSSATVDRTLRFLGRWTICRQSWLEGLLPVVASGPITLSGEQQKAIQRAFKSYVTAVSPALRMAKKQIDLVVENLEKQEPLMTNIANILTKEHSAQSKALTVQNSGYYYSIKARALDQLVTAADLEALEHHDKNLGELLRWMKNAQHDVYSIFSSVEYIENLAEDGKQLDIDASVLDEWIHTIGDSIEEMERTLSTLRDEHQEAGEFRWDYRLGKRVGRPGKDRDTGEKHERTTKRSGRKIGQ